MFSRRRKVIFAIAATVIFFLGNLSSATEATLESQVDSAWNAIWTNFYSSQTNLFYDFLETLDPGATLDSLPTPDEVKSLDPNPCGYGTGMEDCAISGGIILDALIDRYANEQARGADATSLERIKSQAKDVFAGLELLATVSGSPGFVARGVSPKAPDVCYINSSRDQVTHLTLAVWEYFRSQLSDEETRPRAAAILFAVADRMTRNVTPENDYDFLCSDGSHCRIGICRMANVEDHEAARLTAIYAVAWDAAKTLGDVDKTAEYWERWRAIASETVAQSAHIMENEDLLRRMPPYAYLQMQESLNVLYRLETDSALKDALAKTLAFISNRVAARQEGALKKLKSRDLTAVAPDWRKAGGLNGDYRVTWYAPRECGEIALTIASNCASDSFDDRAAETLRDALMTPDFSKITSCGVFHLVGAYEKARRLGKL